MSMIGTTAEVRQLLARWVQRGWLRKLDLALAEFLADSVSDAPPMVVLTAALCSHQLGRGHTCLDLAAVLAEPNLTLALPPEGGDSPHADTPADILRAWAVHDWLGSLESPRLVGCGAAEEPDTPLVCDGARVYLRRYWRYEQRLAQGVAARLAASPLDVAQASGLRGLLDQLFPPELDGPAAGGPNWQKLACAVAAQHAFSVITGGPGTGKTTTVVRLLAVLQSLALQAPEAGELGRPLRIRLAAPTGKAAARLNASIAGAVDSLPWQHIAAAPQVREAIPTEVVTLHRLLGVVPNSRTFRHHARRPLMVDVLVVDEASMVDLEMMTAVLDALPTQARLILLGDKDQLASVDAGAVLGQLCQRAEQGHYSAETCASLHQLTGEVVPERLISLEAQPLDQAVAMLRVSRRFDSQSGIGQLAQAIHAGDPLQVHEVLQRGTAGVQCLEVASQGGAAWWALIVEGYRGYLDVLRQLPAEGVEADVWAEQVLRSHTQFQVLCAVRDGEWGVSGLNARIAHALQTAGLIPAQEGWYVGRPVMVTNNDYGLGLMNGDVGLTVTSPEDGRLRVIFPAADGSGAVKWVLPSRLQQVETVYAMTVHKSQGSEFNRVALVLPDRMVAVLTRELLYTGVTRARESLTLVTPGPASVLAAGVVRQVERASGLLPLLAAQATGGGQATGSQA